MIEEVQKGIKFLFKKYRVGSETVAVTSDRIGWVKCSHCNVTVFEWRDNSAFHMPLMLDAVMRHETLWHAE